MQKINGPYIIDYCHGMVGGPAVLGPTGTIGFMHGPDSDRKAEELCNKLNIGWSVLGDTIEFLREKRKELEQQIRTTQNT